MPKSFHSMETVSEKIKKKSLELGFYQCGFSKAEALEEEKIIFANYLAKKRNAGLHYLERFSEKRTDPRLVMEGARSVVALLMNYYPSSLLPEKDNFVIAKYAYGKDYHTVLMNKLKELSRFMKEELGASAIRAFVDSAPLLEKKWAQRCGLGWIGKNTVLINKSAGSFFVIGVLLTDLVLEYDHEEKNRCGTCEKCLKACPTGALLEPNVLDPQLCIAYHTLENKNDLPEELKDRFNDRIYGCDICQDVCPFNSFAVPNSEPEFAPDPSLYNMHKTDWITLKKETFSELFKGTPVNHIGYDRLMRNIRFLSIPG
jgi:epoxyqueuosine reductase